MLFCSLRNMNWNILVKDVFLLELLIHYNFRVIKDA
jgi:hypothetical protein